MKNLDNFRELFKPLTKPKIKKILVEDRYHLKALIQEEIQKNGNEVNLNHFDTSKVESLNSLFLGSEFNGDISEWDTSNVQEMEMTFEKSLFNKDISKWDTSKVISMSTMFAFSKFNQDISRWNTSNVTNMYRMFEDSQFNGDISQWSVDNVRNMSAMFYQSNFIGNLDNWKPLNLYEFKIFGVDVYWNIHEKEQRDLAIKAYHLNKTLNESLEVKKDNNKKIKL